MNGYLRPIQRSILRPSLTAEIHPENPSCRFTRPFIPFPISHQTSKLSIYLSALSSKQTVSREKKNRQKCIQEPIVGSGLAGFFRYGWLSCGVIWIWVDKLSACGISEWMDGWILAYILHPEYQRKNGLRSIHACVCSSRVYATGLSIYLFTYIQQPPQLTPTQLSQHNSPNITLPTQLSQPNPALPLPIPLRSSSTYHIQTKHNQGKLPRQERASSNSTPQPATRLILSRVFSTVSG
jgi:hypothetical protein